MHRISRMIMLPFVVHSREYLKSTDEWYRVIVYLCEQTMIRPTIFDPVRAQRTVSVSYLWTINIAKWIARRMGYDVWRYSTTASIIHDLSMQREWWHTQWLVESVFDVLIAEKAHVTLREIFRKFVYLRNGCYSSDGWKDSRIADHY